MLEKARAYRDAMAWAVETAMGRGSVEDAVSAVVVHDAAQKVVDALEAVQPPPVAPEAGGAGNV